MVLWPRHPLRRRGAETLFPQRTLEPAIYHPVKDAHGARSPDSVDDAVELAPYVPREPDVKEPFGRRILKACGGQLGEGCKDARLLPEGPASVSRAKGLAATGPLPLAPQPGGEASLSVAQCFELRSSASFEGFSLPLDLLGEIRWVTDGSGSVRALLMASSSSWSVKYLGVLTGVSYVSGIDYFKTINARVGELVPQSQCLKMNKNARMCLACRSPHCNLNSNPAP